MLLMLSEIVDLINKQQSLDEKKKILVQHKSPALLTILRYGLDSRIQFDTEIPTYKPDTSPIGLSYGSLHKEYRRLYIFTKVYRNVNINRKKMILAQILESINPTEAKLLESVLLKKFSLNGVTNEFLNSVFPELMLPVPIKEENVRTETVQEPVESATEQKQEKKVFSNGKKSKKVV